MPSNWCVSRSADKDVDGWVENVRMRVTEVRNPFSSEMRRDVIAALNRRFPEAFLLVGRG